MVPVFTGLCFLGNQWKHERCTVHCVFALSFMGSGMFVTTDLKLLSEWAQSVRSIEVYLSISKECVKKSGGNVCFIDEKMDKEGLVIYYKVN